MLPTPPAWAQCRYEELRRAARCRGLQGLGEVAEDLGYGRHQCQRWWAAEHVKKDVWLYSTSGGTDLCTAFVGGVPLLPVRSGELQARALGAKIEAYDENAEPVINEVGELVITEPMPSMPIYLWNEESGECYLDSY